MGPTVQALVGDTGESGGVAKVTEGQLVLLVEGGVGDLGQVGKAEGGERLTGREMGQAEVEKSPARQGIGKRRICVGLL